MEKVKSMDCTRFGCAQTSETSLRTWTWSITILVLFVAQVIMNVLASEQFGSFGGASNAALSAEQPTFITPDGLTFSVWGIIYLFQGIFTIYQVLPCFQNSHAGVARARFWVAVLFLGNCLWLPVFSNRLYWLAFLLMLVMDLSLVMIYRTMMINYGAVDLTQSTSMLLPSAATEDAEQTSSRLGHPEKIPGTLTHPTAIKILAFVGFSTNISWLAVASMVNLVVATGTSGFNTAITVTNATSMVDTTVYVNGTPDFAIMAVCLVGLLACILVIRNGDVPYAVVAMWALGGIYRAQAVKAANGYPVEAMDKNIACWCVGMIITVAIATVVGLGKAIWETVRARKENDEHVGDGKGDSNSKLFYSDER